MAQRRCLMILSVLSGEKTVEDVTREAQITPPLYYQLEKKALTAMIAALVPGAASDGSPPPAMKQMERRIADLERAKRRLERLLFLTRLTIKPGPMTQGRRGRPKKVRLFSTTTGLTPWEPKKTTRPSKSQKATVPPSTPTTDGADAP